MKHGLIVLLILMVSAAPGQVRAEESLPLAAGMCVNRVNALIQREKIGEAIDALQAFSAKQKGLSAATARKKGYSHYYIDFMLGNCFLMLDRNQKNSIYLRNAARALERAVKKKPDLHAAWVNLARCRYDLGQTREAGFCFVKAYDTARKKNPDYLYYASVCETVVGEYAKALDLFNRLIAAHPDKIRLEWKETRVNILLSLEKNRQALPWIEQLAAKTKGKKKKNWQEMLLHQYMTLKMDQKALAYAGFLTRTDPTEPKWWKALTHIHLGRNQLEQGLVSLLVFSYLTPLSDQETALMGDLYMACNIPLKAAQYYETWVGNQSNFLKKGKNTTEQAQDRIQDRIHRICQAYLFGGDPEAALSWIEKGLGRKKDPRLMQMKADLLFGQKKYAAAFRGYEQLSRFKRKRGQALLMMGYSAWNAGDTREAARAFSRAVQFKHQKKSAARALEQLN